MTNIREVAIHCEAKKHAYRQVQDGVVVSFVLHPQEVPEGLATASLGTRYMLALVEIGDDEQPKIAPPKIEDKVSKSWHDMMPAQQAGILCNEPAFTRFLSERYPDALHNSNASQAIRDICGVTSRSHIVPGTSAGGTWRAIASDYRAWMLEPEIVG